MEKKRIMILCGGRFAFPSLQTLGMEQFLCAVGIGKGEKETIAVLENEAEKGLTFKSFPNKKSLSGLRKWIDGVKPDYIFSISFPFLISEEVLSYGEDRFINFHPGPLPEYRGPMPIFEILRNMEKETAISVHFMNRDFDEGPIILKEKVPVAANETYGEVAIKMSERTAMVVLNMAHMLQFASSIPRTEQDETQSFYFDKPQLEETFVSWNTMAAHEIIALVNACNPWNQGADAILFGRNVKIINATVSEHRHIELPGKVLELTSDALMPITCLDGETINVSIIGGDFGICTAKKFMAGFTPVNYHFN